MEGAYKWGRPGGGGCEQGGMNGADLHGAPMVLIHESILSTYNQRRADRPTEY